MYLLVAAVASTTILTTSCEKDDDDPNAADAQTKASMDYSTAENSWKDIVAVNDESANENPGLGKNTIADGILGTCAEVSVDSSRNPKTMTITFTGNCTGNDGRIRFGKLNVQLYGKYHTKGSYAVITLDGYGVIVNGDSVKQEGKLTVKNMGTNTAGKQVFDLVVENHKVTFNTHSWTWNSTRSYEWTDGYNTPLIAIDNVWDITGSAVGVKSDNTTYSLTIVKPLNVAILCKWIRAGSINIQYNAGTTQTLDFGSGNCDNNATCSVGGKTYDFKMN